ncbi:MAG: hypothetical protein PHP10_05665, partial [Candidatus Omnitrophica bacterium]|nr:hypothetical protein [Candidatus Omnitrophota bacterium]
MKKLPVKNISAAFGLCVFILFFSRFIGLNLGVPFFLIILYIAFKPGFAGSRNLKLSGLAFLFLVSFSAGFILLANGLSYYFIPIAIIPMISMLIFNSLEITYFLALATSFSLASLTPEPFEAWFIFMVSSICAVLLLKGARKRTTVIWAGAIAGIMQLAGILLFEHLQISSPERYL